MARRNETEEDRAARKAASKAAKAEKRAVRQGLGDPAKGRKPCTLCGRPRDLLIRCQVDPSATWHMACGKCWMDASGGTVDGAADRPYYRYGGLWKNHHQAASGRNKVPAAAKATAGAATGVAEAAAAKGRGRGSGASGRGGDGSGSGSRSASEGEEEGDVAELAPEVGEKGGADKVEVGGSSRVPSSGAAAVAAAAACGAGGPGAAANTQALLLREAAECEAEDSR